MRVLEASEFHHQLNGFSQGESQTITAQKPAQARAAEDIPKVHRLRIAELIASPTLEKVCNPTEKATAPISGITEMVQPWMLFL